MYSVLSQFKPSGHFRNHYHGLPGASLSLSLSALHRQAPGWLICFVGTPVLAEQLASELTLYLQDSVPIIVFPDWETLPYDQFSPHEDIISERILALHTLQNTTAGILCVPIATALQRLAPPTFLQHFVCAYCVGQTLRLEQQKKVLLAAGYTFVAQVQRHGEFAIRGSVIDLFPMGTTEPVRLEIAFDEVVSLRTFDVDTQRSQTKIDEICILPAKEFPTTPEGVQQFRLKWRECFSGRADKVPLYEQVSQQQWPAGIEYYLPLFFQETATLFDYLPENSWCLTLDDIYTDAQSFWAQVEERYEQYKGDCLKPLLPPSHLYCSVEVWFQKLNTYSQWRLQTVQKAESTDFQPLPTLTCTPREPDKLKALRDFLTSYKDFRVLFTAPSQGRREVLRGLLTTLGPLQVCETFSEFQQGQSIYSLLVAPFTAGFIWPEQQLLVMTESDLLGRRTLQTKRRDHAFSAGADAIQSLAEVHQGDLVVHFQHGVGRYQGLTTLTLDGQSHEFVLLEFAGADKLYMPVTSLNLMTRYSHSQQDTVALSKLGSEQWAKTKNKAVNQIADTAAELLTVYAKRQAVQGTAFLECKSYTTFVDGFPFEETPDQQAAITAVIQDLKNTNPMDRVICGDVGFGKTEVAMRAAFWVAAAGYQVVVLVPTTLLAQQHFETFRDRFADFPMVLALLSRFRTGTEQTAIQADAAAGKIDIIIGTHKLLSKQMKFKKLGLVIIDEEHRFGVQQKEVLKQLRTTVDILTLTATPIPRTLNMAMAGIRDLSLIATPPAKRLSVRTFVRPYRLSIVLEAIARELHRGGQVYYVHNEVLTITQVAEQLQKSLPQVKIAIAHGQMPERQLELVMRDFYHQRYQVLVCTTIIETGIDVPTANTMIINRADKFGLAQLHQLRGRIGRSHHQAYALLLTAHEASLSQDAARRLQAIQAADSLGAGLSLATSDLEIRGAGELLGKEQSGHMQAIGFTLYNEWLNKAVQLLRQGTALTAEQLQDSVEIDLKIPALIPDAYVPDVHTRLLLYRRLALATSKDQVWRLQEEFTDRFGRIPEATLTLFSLTRLRLDAQSFKIKKIVAGRQGVLFSFVSPPPANIAEKIVHYVTTEPARYTLKGPCALFVGVTTDVLTTCETFLMSLDST